MQVFISWSKEPSREVAAALREWLPDVIQALKPWMSSTDLGAGTRWSGDVADALSSAKIGIICVTKGNQAEPWLLFEAGALAKTVEQTFVCPYLIQMRASDLQPGPLTQFQSKEATKDGTRELVFTINKALESGALSEQQLGRLFDAMWPGLEEKLDGVTVEGVKPAKQRESTDMIPEILETVRSISRRMPEMPAEAVGFAYPTQSFDLEVGGDGMNRLLESLGPLTGGNRARIIRRLRTIHPYRIVSLSRDLMAFGKENRLEVLETYLSQLDQPDRGHTG